MGQYEPDDSRDITLSSNTAPGEPERTGPREGETRRGEQGRAQKNQDSSRTDSQAGDSGQGQAGYGNSRDEDGKMEQDAISDAKADKSADGDRFAGETSANPARRAQADAKRPLGSD